MRIFEPQPNLMARFVAAHLGVASGTCLLATGASLGWRLLTAS